MVNQKIGKNGEKYEKKNAKAKNAAIKRYKNMTGGGPACSSSLSNTETEVLISPMQTDGIGVEETPLEFSFEEQSLPSTETPLEDVIYDITEMDSEKEKVEQKIVTETEEKNNGALQEHNYTLEYPIQKKEKVDLNHLEKCQRLLGYKLHWP
ncbi:uncharacterized protein [Diabrotica undecimpunctata]|uniref:uncharacterized protein n=1 Tax=Diabrotica undecimpunctata TaxID=50387 RepID=UPI003B63DDCC